jgi:nucleotide-binding universal stress UspA family protein
MWQSPIVRLLAVIDVPTPPFTSLTSFARKAYREALQSWKEQAEIHVQQVIDQIVLQFTGCIDVVQVGAARGRSEPALIEHANAWEADVIVISAPASPRHSWLWPGNILSRLMPALPCPVMITKRGA